MDIFRMNSLKTKINILVIGLLIVIFGLSWGYSYWNQYKEALKEARDKATIVTKILGGISSYTFLTQDYTLLDETIQKAMEQEEVLYIKIVDKDGNTKRENNKDRKNERRIEVKEPIIVAEAPAGDVIIGFSTEKSYAMIQKNVKVTLIQVLAGLILSSTLLIFLLNRLVIKPIEIINTTMKEIERGDLTRGISLGTSSGDEVGGLAEAINRVINTLSGIISRSKSAATNVSIASEQILMKSKRMTEGAKTQVEAVDKTSSSIQELNSSIREIAGSASTLSTSAEETSSSVLEIVSSIEEVAHNASGLAGTISETTASLEQIGASVKEVARSSEVLEEAIAETGAAAVEIDAAVRTVADNAKESARLADKVVTDASEHGMLSIVDAIDGMDKIKGSVKKAGDSVNHLKERSQEISKIVTVIDDITARTNLLALNAAILAAQAGEHGKSFSVVAEEIRDLAEKTSTSTKEIAQLIKTIQQETQDTVDIMREGLVRVDDGSKLVHTAGDALREIIHSSQQSQNAAKGIEGAASEQARGVRQVAESVERIRDMIGQIVNASRELRKGTDQIVKAMEVVDDVSKQVKKATAEQSKGSKQIGAVSEDTADKTQLIAKATEEQRVGTEVILKSIDEVKTVAMEGMDIASEIDLSMEALRKEAEGLKRELEIFRIK